MGTIQSLKITAPHEVRLIEKDLDYFKDHFCLKITAPHEVRLMKKLGRISIGYHTKSLKITAPHEVRLIYWLNPYVQGRGARTCLKITAPHEVRLINTKRRKNVNRIHVSK